MRIHQGSLHSIWRPNAQPGLLTPLRQVTSAPQPRTAPPRLGTARPFYSMESLFMTAMRVRDRYLALHARASPDDTAKFETLRVAAAGKEHPAVVAYQQNSLAFGFSAGGMLFPYFLGVCSALTDLGVMIPGRSHLAGASAGSLIAGCYNAGMAIDDIMVSCLDLSEDLRRGGSFRRMGPTLAKILQTRLPEDAHLRCSGYTHISLTTFPAQRNQMVSNFESRDDLIAALLTSCHIPVYFAGTLWTKFRDQSYYDGGLSAFLPVPKDADFAYAVKVCCFPSKDMSFLGDVHIAPDCFDDTWTNIPLSQLLSWALAPAEDHVLEKFFDKGKADAVRWAQLTGVSDAAAPNTDDAYRDSHTNVLLNIEPPCMAGTFGAAGKP